FIVIALFILSAGGAFAYQYYTNRPQAVWNRYTASAADKVYQVNYDLTYQTKSDSAPVSAELKGTSYSNAADSQNTQASHDFTVSFKSGTTGFSQDLEVLVLNKVLYINTAKIPQLKDFLGSTQPDWVKIDYDELKDYLRQSGKQIGPDPFASATGTQTDFVKASALSGIIKPGQNP